MPATVWFRSRPSVLTFELLGRNGGHLTPRVFPGFVTRQTRYGTEEAKKAYNLENYTTDELVKIIEAERLADLVDFVYSQHILTFVTEEEEQAALKDFVAAKAAGANLESVQWKSKEEMLSVSFSDTHLCHNNLCKSPRRMESLTQQAFSQVTTSGRSNWSRNSTTLPRNSTRKGFPSRFTPTLP